MCLSSKALFTGKDLPRKHDLVSSDIYFGTSLWTCEKKKVQAANINDARSHVAGFPIDTIEAHEDAMYRRTPTGLLHTNRIEHVNIRKARTRD